MALTTTRFVRAYQKRRQKKLLEENDIKWMKTQLQ